MKEIVKKPVITEKATKLGEKGQYVFEVNPNSNKIEIKKSIEKMFEVNVTSIRTVRIKGKVKSRITRRGLIRGKTSMKKKAYVTLKAGQTIDIVSGTPGT
ncbi:MAG: 50S ribosomal protein L23 [Candidatus Kapabacteria bacterium]|nr:50S ribosomal protein L23 [Candidatus Kapabacteria bacterium]